MIGSNYYIWIIQIGMKSIFFYDLRPVIIFMIHDIIWHFKTRDLSQNLMGRQKKQIKSENYFKPDMI